MKKLLYSLAVIAAMFCSSCDHYDHAIADQGDRIAQIEKYSIKDIDEQVNAINTSLVDFEAVDASLQTLIDGLQSKADSLLTELNGNASADASLKESLQESIEDINEVIEDLKEMDSNLDGKVADLKTYVDSVDASMSNSLKEWAETTFATLKHYDSLQTSISGLSTKIDGLETAVGNINTSLGNIETSIDNLETSMKSWVNDTLANGYYTIAQLDAKLTALAEKDAELAAKDTLLENADAELEKLILAQQDSLAAAKTSITSAYESAISAAILKYDGEVTDSIAVRINAAKTELQGSINDINEVIVDIEERLDSIEERLDAVEGAVENLAARIQSIRFLPEYSDGKVELVKDGTTLLTFIVSPKEAVDSIDIDEVNAFIVRTKQRTKSVDAPTALVVESVAGDSANGLLEVAINAENLPLNFWTDSQDANIFINISDGNNDIISEMIPICTIVNKYFLVDSQAAAQAVLDNAAEGTIIKLAPGVNYGTLYLRPVKGSAATKDIDWLGNNYGYESYSLFENLTIIGAEGATVDAVEIEGGTYYYSEHSQKDKYPVMLSLVELKNVVFDGVTFTGNGGYDPQNYGNVINLSGRNIKVDGLTFKNCVLSNSGNNARLIYKTEDTNFVHNYTYEEETFTFTPTLKDITVTGCKFNGGYMGLELRETENITITNNEFNVADRNILLPSNTGCTYSGKIIITGNVSNNAKERFVRADGTGDAVVVIKDNTLNDYVAKDTDYVKVTNGNNMTIENNKLQVSTSDGLAAAIKVGGEFKLMSNITLESSISIANADFVLDGNKNTIYQDEQCVNKFALIDASGEGNIVIKNVTFDGIKDGAVLRTTGGTLTVDNITVKNCNHTKPIYGMFRLIGKNEIKNSTFKDNKCISVITLNTEGDGNTDPQLVSNCIFSNNTCSTTAVVHYSTGGAATIDGCKFLENTLTVTNGATLYLGFKKNCTVTNNIFDGNKVTATSKRSSGGLMVGNDAVVRNNCFVNNIVTVNGLTTGYGNDVCASAYYAPINLSGNYWGGGKPEEGNDYYREYPDKYEVIIEDYLTTYEGY